ncbi:MAG: hypothetical protein ACQ9MH_18720 [Nitrospinales bacterium]
MIDAVHLWYFSFLRNGDVLPVERNGMIIALVGFIALFFITFLIYYYTTPKHINIRTRTIYNYLIFAIAVLAFLSVYAYTYINNGLSIERAMLSLLAYLQSLLAISAVLIVGVLFRNFIMFRKKK